MEKKMDLREPYDYLLSMPGVGRILALTMMLETGPIGRFEHVGNYASYCRKVPSSWRSNDKKKGKGNKKNGNKYISHGHIPRQRSSHAGLTILRGHILIARGGKRTLR